MDDVTFNNTIEEVKEEETVSAELETPTSQKKVHYKGAMDEIFLSHDAAEHKFLSKQEAEFIKD